MALVAHLVLWLTNKILIPLDLLELLLELVNFCEELTFSLKMILIVSGLLTTPAKCQLRDVGISRKDQRLFVFVITVTVVHHSLLLPRNPVCKFRGQVFHQLRELLFKA